MESMQCFGLIFPKEQKVPISEFCSANVSYVLAITCAMQLAENSAGNIDSP